MAHKEKKQKKSFGFFWTILFLLALSVFCFSAYQLFDIYRGYKQGVDEYLSVSHETVVRNQEPLVVKEQAETEEVPLVEPEEVTYQPPEVNFDELQQMNPDVLGWLEIEAIPDISYPVVQAEDNAYYLKHTFKKTENSAGSIFVDYINNRNLTDCHTIIYGHNMKNGSMFGKLKELYEKEKYKDSRYLWICTPAGKYRYEIFSMQYADVNSETYTLFQEHNEEFGAYLERMRDKSEVDLGVKYLSKDDYVITLSTCTSNDQIRFVVQARWVATY